MDLKKLKEEIYADPELKARFDRLANHPMSFTAVWKVEANGDAIVSFGKEEDDIEIESSNDDYDEDGNFIGMCRVWDALDEIRKKHEFIRADRIYSLEDDKVLYKNGKEEVF
jgi:hypothetical protein